MARVAPRAAARPDLRTAARWSADRAHLPLAGLLTAYFGFQAGGFFPTPVALAAAVLLVAAVVRLTVAQRPVEGWNAVTVAIAFAGAGLASWTLLSSEWSHSPGRALVEFDRTLLYLVTFCLIASVPRRPTHLPALLRWVLAAMVAIAIVGLATRLYPDRFAADVGRAGARLAYPLTYWNAEGVLFALAAVLAVHLASADRERLAMRMAAGAALPVLVLAGYFPFSRGGIAAAALGLVLYTVLAWPRRLIVTILTAGPPAAIALHSAYSADQLATVDFARAGGPAQGHHVALVLVACAVGAALARLAVAPLERRFAAWRPDARRRRSVTVAVAALAVLVVAVAAVALDAPARARAQYRAFVNGNFVSDSGDLRGRLQLVGNNGRIAVWKVSLQAFRAHPLDGTGAGTYQLSWELRRPNDLRVRDGHSLYLEPLGEMGVVGEALLVVFLGGLVVGPLRGLFGPGRQSHAAVLAAALTLLAHAAVDWDWEMPVLFAWLFAAGGMACANRAGTVADARPVLGRLPRILGGLACLLLAVTPVLVARSQSALDEATRAFLAGDCTTAVDKSLDSLQSLGMRPEPYELIGYCDLRANSNALALRAMRSAHRHDPRAWQYLYGVAVAQAIAGQDPRGAAEEAVRLNPREPLARTLRARFERAPRRRWPTIAAQSPIPSS